MRPARRAKPRVKPPWARAMRPARRARRARRVRRERDPLPPSGSDFIVHRSQKKRVEGAPRWCGSRVHADGGRPKGSCALPARSPLLPPAHTHTLPLPRHTLFDDAIWFVRDPPPQRAAGGGRGGRAGQAPVHPHTHAQPPRTRVPQFTPSSEPSPFLNKGVAVLASAPRE